MTTPWEHGCPCGATEPFSCDYPPVPKPDLKTLPIIQVIEKRFRCASCNRGYASKQGLYRHMETCWKTPENKGCGTCQFFSPAYSPMFGPENDCSVGFDLDGRDLRLHCPRWAQKGETLRPSGEN